MCTRGQEFKVMGEGSMSIYYYDKQKLNLLERHDLEEDTFMKNAYIPTTGLNKIKVISIDKTEEPQ